MDLDRYEELLPCSLGAPLCRAGVSRRRSPRRLQIGYGGAIRAVDIL